MAAFCAGLLDVVGEEAKLAVEVKEEGCRGDLHAIGDHADAHPTVNEGGFDG